MLTQNGSNANDVVVVEYIITQEGIGRITFASYTSIYNPTSKQCSSLKEIWYSLTLTLNPSMVYITSQSNMHRKGCACSHI